MPIDTYKILFVDDCPEDIEIYRRYLLQLSQHSYDILEVSTGSEALDQCFSQFPDAIVLDYMLPDMDGLELLDKFKTQFGENCPPVIMLTGQGNEQVAVQAMKSGAADYLVKNKTTQLSFLKAVANVLEQKVERDPEGNITGFIGIPTDTGNHKQAEAALPQHQEMFSALVENAPFGIYLIDAEFRLQHINQGASAVFSNIDSPIGRDFAEILRIIWQEPFATEAINRFRHTLATGESYYSPTIVEPRANIEDIQTYDWQIHRIVLPDGSYGVVCYFYDLSEIKRAEEIIRRTAQRDTFLITLSDALRPLTVPVELQAMATQILGEYLGANRALYFEVRGSDYVVERDYVNGAQTLAGIYPIDAFGQSLIADYRAGRTVVQPDVATDPLLLESQRTAYAAIQIGAHIGIPLIKDGEFVAGLAVHMDRPRVWTQDEVSLTEEVAERTWAAVERARAEAAVAANLRDTQLLRNLSARLISEADIQIFYDEIVATAIALMHSDMGSLQILDRNRNELHLQSYQGFHPDAAVFWSTVAVGEGSVCSAPLGLREQVIIPDVEACNFIVGTAALDYFHLCGIRSVQSTPLVSRSGQLIGMLSTYWSKPQQPSARELRFLDLLARQATDLIEQQQAEAEQKQAQEKIREQAALLDVVTDAIFVRDLENRILFWNQGAQNLYGWTVAESLAKQAHTIFNREPLTEIEPALEIVITQGFWQGELEQVTKTGKEITVASRWILVQNESGNPQSILVVNTDITEKKQLEQQFYQAQRLESLGVLASGIAHDLNNILTPILSVAQLLPIKFPNLGQENQQLLKILEDSSKRAAELVKQITAFARGAEGKRIPVRLRHLLKEIEQITKSTFPKSIQIFTPMTNPNLWTVSADPTQIHQMLVNLCVNARDAMLDGGTLTISAENFHIDENYAQMNLGAKVGDYVMITVTDTGCGMRPDVRERIFEPFFTTKEIGKGTGLGLSTVAGIIKSHEGFINVRSEVGEGSQFQVFLKAIKASVTKNNDDFQMVLGHGELILVADDEVFVREIAKVALSEANYRVITASDGIDAFSVYAQNKNEISLVLIDIQMPSFDGLKAVPVLQSMNPAVKIIVISGLLSNRKLLETNKINVEAFLLKPYTIEELLGTIKSILA